MKRQLVVFSLEGQRYGLFLESVKRVLRAVAVTTLPRAPAIVLGIVDLQGDVVPVINLRKRFGHPSRDMRLSDQILFVNTATRTVALVVDETTGVLELNAEHYAPAQGFAPKQRLFDGAVKTKDGLILIHDLEQLLSLEEEEAIAVALKEALDQREADREPAHLTPPEGSR